VDHVNQAWRFVLAGGLVAGTFDIVYACVFWAIKRGVSPQRILQRVDPLWVGMSIVVHLFLIGLPCAVFARRAMLADLRSPVPA